MIFMFAMLDGFILHTLPFSAPDELLYMSIRSDLAGVRVRSNDLLQIRRQLAGSAEVAGAAGSTMDLSDLDRPEHYIGAHITADLFHVLGVAPILGREFSANDEHAAAPAVAMLSYELWQGRYAGDPAIVGKQIRIDSRAATVVGVMPANFSYPENYRYGPRSAYCRGRGRRLWAVPSACHRHPGLRIGDGRYKPILVAISIEIAGSHLRITAGSGPRT